MKKNSKFLIVASALIIYLIILFFSRENKELKNDVISRNFYLFDNFDGNPLRADFDVIEINLNEFILQRDSIDVTDNFYEFEGKDHIFSFLFPEDYKVICIEREDHFYPSIFASETDTISKCQYLKLEDLVRIKQQKLDLINTVQLESAIRKSKDKKLKRQIEKNKSLLRRVLNSKCLFLCNALSYPTDITSNFKSITKIALARSIINAVTRECEQNEDWDFLEDKNSWLSYTRNYKVGEFSPVGKTFSVDIFEVSFKIKLIIDEKVVTKVFYYRRHIGN